MGPDVPGAIPSARERRWRNWACFLLMLAANQLMLGPVIRLSQWDLSAEIDAGVAEGLAWLNHRLDIPHPGRDAARDRMHDTAYYNGKVYNVFPPLVPLLTVVVSPLHRLIAMPTDRWFPFFEQLLFFWPLPIVGFFVFRRQCDDPAWAALLTVGWMGGTALLPNLEYTRHGYLGPINHVLSQIGLLILAADLLGRQRIWPALIGLFIAVWSRQMTCLYAMPLLYVAWQRRRLMLCLLGLVVIAAPILTLNWLKFGNVAEFGYRFIYVNRDDAMAQRASHGIFSPVFFMENLWYMHAELPAVEPGLTNVRIAASGDGASIWFTSPILLYVLIDARRWWRDPRRRLLMLSTIPVMLGLLFYHTTGFMQIGYNRFALDFIPIWLAVIAPFSRGGWRTWFTLAATAWSLLYFQSVIRIG